MTVTIQKEATHTITGTGFTEGIHFMNEKENLMSSVSQL